MKDRSKSSKFNSLWSNEAKKLFNNGYSLEQFKKIVENKTRSTSFILVSDMHCRSDFAVASDYVQKNFTMKYPSIQKGLFEAWNWCLDQRLQSTDYLVLNGEPDDGNGEILKGQEVWSPLPINGIDDAYRLLNMYEPKKFLATKGSGYHSDFRSINAESLVMDKFGDRAIEFNPYEGMGEVIDGKSKNVYSYLWVEINGLLLCIAHHISGSKNFHYLSMPVGREMANLTFEANKWLPKEHQGKKFIVCRAHSHKFVEVSFASQSGFINPAWKLPDWFSHRGGMGGTLPSIGTVEIIVESNGTFEIHPHIIEADRYPKTKILSLLERGGGVKK